jgi:hypothetical protein
MRELPITVESGSQCPQLATFLRDCGAHPRVIDERSLAVDLDAHGCPGLATLVAALEVWRGSSRAGEVSLALDGKVRIMRTEG